MARFFITLAYNGERYVGWQVQPNGMSVQQTLEEALSTITQRPLKVVGAGRAGCRGTCTGDGRPFRLGGGTFRCGRVAVPVEQLSARDIALSSIRPVQPSAHARFSALARTYTYHVTTCKDPFQYPFHYRLHYTPDIVLMNRLGEVLQEYEDFTSFSKLHSDAKTNNCRVTRAEWEACGECTYRFIVQADRFLRNMVRAIVGTMLEAGRGQLDESGFRRVIEARDRGAAGDSVPRERALPRGGALPQLHLVIKDLRLV